VYQAGTLSGNPLATAAGCAVLNHVSDDDYVALTSRVASFATNLASAVADSGLAVAVPSIGPLVGVFLAPPGSALEPPVDYVTAAQVAGNGVYPKFFHAMLRRGVALAPGAYEVMFPGMAHSEEVLNQVVEVAADAAAEVAKGLMSTAG
jgi:glutamate-1-semialdehyde 2,1-aminomutase